MFIIKLMENPQAWKSYSNFMYHLVFKFYLSHIWHYKNSCELKYIINDLTKLCVSSYLSTNKTLYIIFAISFICNDSIACCVIASTSFLVSFDLYFERID